MNKRAKKPAWNGPTDYSTAELTRAGGLESTRSTEHTFDHGLVSRTVYSRSAFDGGRAMATRKAYTSMPSGQMISMAASGFDVLVAETQPSRVVSRTSNHIAPANPVNTAASHQRMLV